MPLTEQQIIAAFQCILRRKPRPQEIRIWTAADHAETLADSLLLQATEPRSITRLYLGLLGLYPDGLEAPYTGDDGLTYWVSNLRAQRAKQPSIAYKDALQHTIIDWFDSEPHKAIYGANNTCDAFIEILFQKALGRSPVESECQEWVDTKEWGAATKAKLAVEVTESQACKLRYNASIDDRLRKLAVASCSRAGGG